MDERQMARIVGVLFDPTAPEHERRMAEVVSAAGVMQRVGELQPHRPPMQREDESPEQYLHVLARVDQRNASNLVTLAWAVAVLREQEAEAEADRLEEMIRGVYRISEKGWPQDGWERRKWAAEHAAQLTYEARERTKRIARQAREAA